ncbi:MAG TPA: DUF692 domain-containing protein [Ramlibacter sp.]|jgi:hypothetical protein|nr:DUF692 domain-containing protein [Ramlibacter sp.]
MAAAGLPARCGVGLKPRHVAELLRDAPQLGFVEVHAENYMVAGGPLHAQLRCVREQHALSLHGVGLSLGGEARPDRAHLERLRELVRRYAPASFSEHLAWSSHGGVFLNGLLPLPYDSATVARVCAHVSETQERLGLRMLLENPSTYVEFEASTMDEPSFLREVARRTGCGLLLDLTNVVVSCANRNEDPRDWLSAFPLAQVGEIHLAGFARQRDAAGAPLLIDDHGSAADARVWSLYEDFVAQVGPVPTLIEWDNDVPPLARLHAEALRAQRMLDGMEACA